MSECSRCHKTKDDDTYRMCDRCRATLRAHVKRQRSAPTRPGKCSICKVSDAPDGFKRCDTCRAKVRRHRGDTPSRPLIYSTNPQKFIEANARRRQLDRVVIIEMYGGKCNCCGVTEFQFLTIDHVNNDGVSDRASILGDGRRHSSRMYRYLMRSGRRDDLQLLCWNCHMAKDLFGGCPHLVS